MHISIKVRRRTKSRAKYSTCYLVLWYFARLISHAISRKYAFAVDILANSIYKTYNQKSLIYKTFFLIKTFNIPILLLFIQSFSKIKCKKMKKGEESVRTKSQLLT